MSNTILQCAQDDRCGAARALGAGWAMRYVGLALALLLMLALTMPAKAQCPPRWLTGPAGPSGTNSDVRALVALPSGDVIVGGSFSLAGGIAANRIARYSPANNTWSALGSGTDGTILALAVLPGGDIVAGGQFTTAGGVPARNIARYNPASNTWTALGSGLGPTGVATVYALAALPGGDVIVGGRFTSAGGVAVGNIARYSPVSNNWSVPGGATFGSEVFALHVLPDGDVLAGTIGITRYSPASNNWSSLGGVSWIPGEDGEPGSVFAFATLPGGDVIAAGYFRDVSGVPANSIARYSPSSNTWSALGSGMNNVVMALAVMPGGDLIAGGEFSGAGGMAASNIARYSPATNAWSPLGLGASGVVFALAGLPGGDLMVGGSINSAGGSPAANLARYSFGTPAPAIGTQPVLASACAVESAVFSVSAVGTGPFSYQWQMQTAPNTWTVLSSSPVSFPCASGGTGTAVAAFANASTVRIRVDGCAATPGQEWPIRCIVSSACGSATSTAAMLRVRACGCNPADLCGSGATYATGAVDIGADQQLTIEDFVIFLAAFTDAAGCPRTTAGVGPCNPADIAGSGATYINGTVDVGPDGDLGIDDFIVFLSAFSDGAGCP